MQIGIYKKDVCPEYVKFDDQQKEKFILSFAPLIEFVVHRIGLNLPSHVDFKDLINIGFIGLIEAIKKYDPTYDTSFRTYAQFRIRGAILDELRRLDWLPRSMRKKVKRMENACATIEQRLGRAATDDEIAQVLNIDLDELHEILNQANVNSEISLCSKVRDDEQEEHFWAKDFLENFSSSEYNPHTLLESKQSSEAILRAIDRLPDKEKCVIRLYYYMELTLKQIGEIMHLTESRISQIHSSALLRLTRKLKNLRDALH